MNESPPASLAFEPASSAILDSISDGVFTVDLNWNITYINHAAEHILGISRSEAIGHPCWEIFRADMCEHTCALRKTLATGTPIVCRHATLVTPHGKRVPISVSTAILYDHDGKILGGAETFRDLTLVEELRRELKGLIQVGEIVSQSPAMRPLLGVLPQVAEAEVSVLIQGETGTGKELIARSLHELSPRRRGPFIAVNCGALPDSLLESELFGYTRGAFTGANRDRQGRFAAAEGGTLFLDEVGDVSPALQVRLLRVLQERSFEPLGSSQAKEVDVRIVAATNRDLDHLIATKEFRQDLFYRLGVVRLHVPPLRERSDDIPLLVDHFVERFNSLHGKEFLGVETEAMRALMNHDFPGNVRELENMIAHAFVFSQGPMLSLADFPNTLSKQIEPNSNSTQPIASSIKNTEANLILTTLKRLDFNRKATAEALGIHKSTLFRKIRRLAIEIPERDGRNR